jgi:hypothetical protein
VTKRPARTVAKRDATRTRVETPAAKKANRTRTSSTRPSKRTTRKSSRSVAIEAVPITARELRELKRELERRTAPTRWNPNPEDVQKSVAQLVLTIVEFLRQLMERQAIRRMEAQTLTPKEVEAVGLALMQLEETVRDIAKKFGITPEELNLDLGAIKLM